MRRGAGVWGGEGKGKGEEKAGEEVVIQLAPLDQKDLPPSIIFVFSLHPANQIL